jgi:hypothetical protein
MILVHVVTHGSKTFTLKNWLPVHWPALRQAPGTKVFLISFSLKTSWISLRLCAFVAKLIILRKSVILYFAR